MKLARALGALALAAALAAAPAPARAQGLGGVELGAIEDLATQLDGANLDELIKFGEEVNAKCAPFFEGEFATKIDACSAAYEAAGSAALTECPDACKGIYDGIPADCAELYGGIFTVFSSFCGGDIATGAPAAPVDAVEEAAAPAEAPVVEEAAAPVLAPVIEEAELSPMPAAAAPVVAAPVAAPTVVAAAPAPAPVPTAGAGAARVGAAAAAATLAVLLL